MDFDTWWNSADHRKKFSCSHPYRVAAKEAAQKITKDSACEEAESALDLYADSYKTMSNIKNGFSGNVACASVEFDVRVNMVASVSNSIRKCA